MPKRRTRVSFPGFESWSTPSRQSALCEQTRPSRIQSVGKEAQTSTLFWTKLEGPVSAGAPQFPMPQGAQDTLWLLLKAVPAEIAKQQPTVAALLTDRSEDLRRWGYSYPGNTSATPTWQRWEVVKRSRAG